LIIFALCCGGGWKSIWTPLAELKNQTAGKLVTDAHDGRPTRNKLKKSFGQTSHTALDSGSVNKKYFTKNIEYSQKVELRQRVLKVRFVKA